MNPDIGYTKKYDPETRAKIAEVVRSEWSKNKEQFHTAEEFGTHMEGVLKSLGFKSPTGGPLTPRGVRFQVFKAGITFPRGLRKGTKLGPREKKPVGQKRRKRRVSKPQATPVPVAQPSFNPMVQKLLEEIKRVMGDTLLNDSQKVRLIQTHLEIAA
jgi:hypothetical protein